MVCRNGIPLPASLLPSSRTGAGGGAEGSEEELDSGTVKIGWEIGSERKK